ncbi:MAG: CPBP family intramembrane metalloprotease [Spirochaetaceae bacterium]|nr:CPBP family intramembrane metalloprotease [Spirochaetaceae bacterium]
MAVIVPAILFACLHILNMTNFNLLDLILLILAGSSVSIMFTLFALESNSIWPGALAHSLWNLLIIGNVFGIGGIVNGEKNNSYIVIPVESTSTLLTGGNFGVEAALPAIIGYILVSVIVYMRIKKSDS